MWPPMKENNPIYFQPNTSTLNARGQCLPVSEGTLFQLRFSSLLSHQSVKGRRKIFHTCKDSESLSSLRPFLASNLRILSSKITETKKEDNEGLGTSRPRAALRALPECHLCCPPSAQRAQTRKRGKVSSREILGKKGPSSETKHDWKTT